MIWYALVTAALGMVGFAVGVMAEQDRQRKRARMGLPAKPSPPPCENCAGTGSIPHPWGGWWACGWCMKAREQANWAHLKRLRAASKPAPPPAPPNDYGDRRGPRPEVDP